MHEPQWCDHQMDGRNASYRAFANHPCLFLLNATAAAIAAAISQLCRDFAEFRRYISFLIERTDNGVNCARKRTGLWDRWWHGRGPRWQG